MITQDRHASGPRRQDRLVADGPADPDQEYVQRAIRGERSAFEVLYQQYVKKLYNLLFRMLRTAAEAEAATQEVFYQAYKGLPTFQGRSRFYTWLFRIGANVALQRIKRQMLSRQREGVSI